MKHTHKALVEMMSAMITDNGVDGIALALSDACRIHGQKMLSELGFSPTGHACLAVTEKQAKAFAAIAGL